MAAEIWRPVKGYEPLYEVSDSGRVRRFSPGQGTAASVLKTLRRPDGYLSVSLCSGGAARKHLVHVLVAEAFLGNRPLGHEVNHKDFNRANCHRSNLEWVTRSENLLHKTRIGGRCVRATGQGLWLEKPFNLTSPEGVQVTGAGLSEFCRTQGLQVSSLSRVLSGKASHHKGWTKGIQNVEQD